MSEPRADALVWVAIRRRGITAHRPGHLTVNGQAHTGCDRSMRTGELVRADTARAVLEVSWCARPGCWPPSTPDGAT